MVLDIIVWEQCKFRGYWNQKWVIRFRSKFESSVNSEGIETYEECWKMPCRFESSVNSEGIETVVHSNLAINEFESSVNSEGIEADILRYYFYFHSLFLHCSPKSQKLNFLDGLICCWDYCCTKMEGWQCTDYGAVTLFFYSCPKSLSFLTCKFHICLLYWKK